MSSQAACQFKLDSGEVSTYLFAGVGCGYSFSGIYKGPLVPQPNSVKLTDKSNSRWTVFFFIY